MKKKESKMPVKKSLKKTHDISAKNKLKTQVKVKDKGLQTFKKNEVKLFYCTNLKTCRSSLNRLLNILNSDPTANTQKIRAQTYIVKSIADIFIAEKQLELEKRIDDLESAINVGTSIANGKEALL